MPLLRKSLLVAVSAFFAAHSTAFAQLRELGTGAPGPVKAQHVTAELISDSGTITPGNYNPRGLVSDARTGMARLLGLCR